MRTGGNSTEQQTYPHLARRGRTPQICIPKLSISDMHHSHQAWAVAEAAECRNLEEGNIPAGVGVQQDDVPQVTVSAAPQLHKFTRKVSSLLIPGLTIEEETADTARPPTRWEKFLTRLDAFQARDTPARFNGGVISILVWMATLGYLGYLIYAMLNAPFVVSPKTEWSFGNGPYPMPITCMTLSGCYVSNRLDKSGTARVEPNPDQQGCMFLEYKESLMVDFVASIIKTDGLAVLFDVNNVDEALPAGGFGFTISSEVLCDWNPDMPCANGTKIRPIPITSGLTYIEYVLTHNLTTSDDADGRLRREFFPIPVDTSANVTPNPLNTPCANEELPDGLVQAKVAIMPSHTIYTVSRNTNIASLIGEVGGAYELMFLFGGLLLLGLSGEGCIIMNIFAALGGI